MTKCDLPKFIKTLFLIPRIMYCFLWIITQMKQQSLIYMVLELIILLLLMNAHLYFNIYKKVKLQ